jgi:hypothetical protein
VRTGAVRPGPSPTPALWQNFKKEKRGLEIILFKRMFTFHLTFRTLE